MDVDLERLELHLHAPAGDRDERSGDRLARDDDDRRLRRFLQRLQQHRGGFVDEVEVDEDEDLVLACPRRAQSHGDDLLGLADRDRGSEPLGQRQVRMAAGEGLGARGALTAPAVRAQQGGGEGDGGVPAARAAAGRRTNRRARARPVSPAGHPRPPAGPSPCRAPGHGSEPSTTVTRRPRSRAVPGRPASTSSATSAGGPGAVDDDPVLGVVRRELAKAFADPQVELTVLGLDPVHARTPAAGACWSARRTCADLERQVQEDRQVRPSARRPRGRRPGAPRRSAAPVRSPGRRASSPRSGRRRRACPRRAPARSCLEGARPVPPA